ncbi:MAG: hypothetical protein HOP09_06320 [Hyphomicrobium sp.]|nr:hypothetical protein [Hyphomicrobium sp.]
MSIATKPRCDLRSEYDMACPQCGQAEALSVEITCTATLSIDGAEAYCDHYWEEASSRSCDVCDHHGTVGEFRITSGKAVQA